MSGSELVAIVAALLTLLGQVALIVSRRKEVFSQSQLNTSESRASDAEAYQTLTETLAQMGEQLAHLQTTVLTHQEAIIEIDSARIAAVSEAKAANARAARLSEELADLRARFTKLKLSHQQGDETDE